MKITKGTTIRTALLVLAVVNQVLYMYGKSPLPIEDEQIESFITNGFSIITTIVVWWKNNSFTKKAIRADKTFK